MLRSTLFLLFLGLSLAFSGAISCGGPTACDQAADILLDCPGAPDFDDAGGSDGSTVEGSCDGIQACSAQCILDNPEAACETFSEEPDLDLLQEFVDCIVDC